MHRHGPEKALQGEGTILLVGNPNVGKSVIFNLLTGRYVTVSNYPGTTVEITRGTAPLRGRKMVVIDTPGTNSLVPFSEDERITRDILLKEKPEVVLQVADAKNLRRALLITIQLAEMGVPLVLDLNMDDEARSRGIFIDRQGLASILGVEVVATIATQRKGLSQLKQALSSPHPSPFRVQYDYKIEASVEEISAFLPEGVPKRALALMLLAGDEGLKEQLKEKIEPEGISEIEAIRHKLQGEYGEPLGYLISRQRLGVVDRIMEEVYRAEGVEREAVAGVIGRLAMHPVWGVPILMIVLYFTYLFVGRFGAQTLVDFMEGVVFGEFINPWAVRLAEATIPISILRDFLVGEYGMITMALSYGFAIILPIVGTFFLVFSFLEDSGYLPRLAVMVNRVFGVMGLNGKAVLPMILGLGCDTMATMTTRILETRKERVQVTLLLALGVPCSAQLGVLLGMMAGLSFRATFIWVGVVIGVIFLVGYLSSRLIPGQGSDFILEVPPIRLPQFSNMAIKTLARIEWYLKEVIPLFVLGTAILFLLDKFRVLAMIERAASPLVVGFLGLPAKATEAFLIGFLRRDYGAAGLYTLVRAGEMDHLQIVVSMVTITLFVPCIANFLMIVKERGLKTALAMVAFIFPFAFLVGGVLNLGLRYLGVVL